MWACDWSSALCFPISQEDRDGRREAVDAEFDRVVDAVTSFALTPLGAEKLARLRPLTDPHSVHTALAHTTEAVRYLDANGVFPLEAPDDLDAILSALAIEAQPLEPAQLLKLTNFLGSVERVCKSVATAKRGPFPAVSAIADRCPPRRRRGGDENQRAGTEG